MANRTDFVYKVKEKEAENRRKVSLRKREKNRESEKTKDIVDPFSGFRSYRIVSDEMHEDIAL